MAESANAELLKFLLLLREREKKKSQPNNPDGAFHKHAHHVSLEHVTDREPFRKAELLQIRLELLKVDH